MKTAKQIFDYISGINPETSTISSMGSFVSETNQQVADSIYREVLKSLPEGTLAHKIANSTTGKFSEKQLWVIAYELEKNAEFASKVSESYGRIERKAAQESQDRKDKLAANKEASTDVLASIKAAGQKLGDYYKWLNTRGNAFRKEYFSKKYTQESAEAFLSIA